ncbi:hypothetical protein [Orenia marismortui]|uniref:Uncharacterized protein n=1 Tax=Orenia marismortui TaxID=46469 RepID=A0A4R8GWY3_9FIRM|nr:hypothetical protein [Orenia marismortui]TDX48214.1 hypothetical protein C7959_1329 [Orenia marismortui]
MTKGPKNKKNLESESVVDYNPDDVEAGEELSGLTNVKGKLKNRERERDLNPDDFEDFENR